MSELQNMNAFLTERLIAAALEISVVFERKISNYQEEILRSNEENKRLKKLLDFCFNPKIKLNRADSQKPAVPFTEELCPQRQSLVHGDTKPIKEEPRSSQDEHTKDTVLIPACVTSDYDQNQPQPIHMDQTLDTRQKDFVATNTKNIQTENYKDVHRVSEPTRNSQSLSTVDPDYFAAQVGTRLCENRAVNVLGHLSCNPEPQPRQPCEQKNTEQIKEEWEEPCTSQEDHIHSRVSEPTSLYTVLEPTRPSRVTEPTSLYTVLEPTSPSRVAEPTSLWKVSEPRSLCTFPQPESPCTVPEPSSPFTLPESTSLSTVAEPTSLCSNPEHSADQSKNMTEVVNVVDTHKVLFLSPDCPPPFLNLSEQEVLPGQQESTTPTHQEETRLVLKEKQWEIDSIMSGGTSDVQLLSALNPYCSSFQRENVEEHFAITSDTQLSSLPVHVEKVLPKRHDCEPDRSQSQKQKKTETISQMVSDSVVTEPNSTSQLLSVEHPYCSNAQIETTEPLHGWGGGRLSREVNRSRTTYLNQDSDDPSSDEDSDFSNWSDEDYSDLDSYSSDSSSSSMDNNIQSDSVVHPPAKRRRPSGGEVDESSRLSNLCDAIQAGTDLSPTDGGKDLKSQTGAGAGSPAKRICRRKEVSHGAAYVMPLTKKGNKNYCLFCGKTYFEFARHLQFQHQDEPDVAKAFSLNKYSEERKMMLTLLMKKGNLQHNVLVARSGTGEMVARSRPRSPSPSEDYMHCLHCHGLYLRRALWLHVKRCPQRPKADEPKHGIRRRTLSQTDFIWIPKPDYVSAGLWKLVGDMNIGEVTFVVRNDKNILLLGEEMFNRLQKNNKSLEYIRQKLRGLARLLIAARKCTPLKSFEDFVLPSNLTHVITAVKAVSGYNEENKMYDCPTLAFDLGRGLRNIARTVQLCAIKSGQPRIAESADAFQHFKWNNVIMAGALSTIDDPKPIAKKHLPSRRRSVKNN
ncbi:hypothetical protein UPYG_G00132260 [Umbra pygmaea]|uniref:Uncharacterized protein n=1 Tax=Umbra pygmaea TaxID=75934 RepID=A0ABD0XBV7_UMBPY